MEESESSFFVLGRFAAQVWHKFGFNGGKDQVKLESWSIKSYYRGAQSKIERVV